MRCQGCRGVRAVLGASRNSRYSVTRRGKEGIKGHLGTPRGKGGHMRCQGCRGVRAVLGASRNSRYSVTRRGKEGIKGHLGTPRGKGGHMGCQGCRGVRAVLGASRDSRYSGTRRDIGASGAPKGCRSIGSLFGGVRVFWGVKEVLSGLHLT